MGDIIDDYLAELRVIGRAPSTIRLRGYQLHAWDAWLVGHGLSAQDVRREHVVDYLATFPEPETRASNMAALRGLCAWLADMGVLTTDPCRRLPSVRRRLGDPHPCPDGVVSQALAVANPAEQCMLILGRFAGLRASEIAHAHSDYLRGSWGHETVRLCGKGGRWREFPAHPAVVEVLSRAAGWVFPSPIGAGSPILPGTVTARLGNLLPGPWTAHSLRHAFASDLYERSGHDLRMVQDALGHANPQTTARYVQVGMDRAAVAAMTLRAA